MFLLLQEEGLKVERLPGVIPSAGGLVILVDPLALPLNSEDTGRLLDWVGQGNTLLCASEGPNLLYQRFGDNPKSTPGQPGKYPVSSEHLFLNDVHELYFSRGSLRLDRQDSADFEYGDEQGIYLNKTIHGKGQVIFLTTPDLLTNADIDQSDNLILFLNIVRLYGQNEIWFAEGGKPTAALPKKEKPDISPLYLNGVQFILGILLLYYFWGKRFGRIIAMGKPGSSNELIEGDYVSSLAIIYRQARARHLIFKSIYQGFREDLTRFSGTPPNTSNERLLKIFSTWPGIDAKKLGGLLAEGEKLLASPNFSETELLKIAIDIETWRKANFSLRGRNNV